MSLGNSVSRGVVTALSLSIALALVIVSAVAQRAHPIASTSSLSSVPAGGIWTNLSPPSSPGSGFELVYESAVDRLIFLDGGSSASNGLAFSTWAFDYATLTWSDTNATNPTQLLVGAAAYDSQTEKVIFVGGTGMDLVPQNQTLAYDPGQNAWTELSPKPDIPPQPAAVVVYDAAADRTVLFSRYYAGSSFHSSTWAYDYSSNAWTNRSPGFAPPAVDWGGMAYDSRADRIVLFGGSYANRASGLISNETWVYDYTTNLWKNLTTASAPGDLSGPSFAHEAFAYDSVADRAVLLTPSMQTWAYDYDNNTWTNQNPVTHPVSNDTYALAYDSAADRVILFLTRTIGPSYTTLRETWAYELGSASAPASTPTGPSPFTLSPSAWWLLLLLPAGVSIAGFLVWLRLRRLKSVRRGSVNDTPVGEGDFGPAGKLR